MLPLTLTSYANILATAVTSQDIPKDAPTIQVHAHIFLYTKSPSTADSAMRNMITSLAESVSVRDFVTTVQWMTKCGDAPELLKIVMAIYAAYAEDRWLLEGGGESAEYWNLYGDVEFKAALVWARREKEMRSMKGSGDGSGDGRDGLKI